MLYLKDLWEVHFLTHQNAENLALITTKASSSRLRLKEWIGEILPRNGTLMVPHKIGTSAFHQCMALLLFRIYYLSNVFGTFYGFINLDTKKNVKIETYRKKLRTIEIQKTWRK